MEQQVKAEGKKLLSGSVPGCCKLHLNTRANPTCACMVGYIYKRCQYVDLRVTLERPPACLTLGRGSGGSNPLEGQTGLGLEVYVLKFQCFGGRADCAGLWPRTKGKQASRSFKCHPPVYMYINVLAYLALCNFLLVLKGTPKETKQLEGVDFCSPLRRQCGFPDFVDSSTV